MRLQRGEQGDLMHCDDVSHKAHSAKFHRRFPAAAAFPPMREMKVMLTIVMLVLLLVFLALAAFRFMPRERTHIAYAGGDFNAISSSLKTYNMHAGHYPSTEQGLEALVNRPTTEPVPKKWSRICDAVPKDPWGNPYQYRLLPKDRKQAFEVYSAGRDRILGTKDDLSSLKIP